MRTPNFSGTVNDIEKKIERKENSGNKLSNNFALGAAIKNGKSTKNELIETKNFNLEEIIHVDEVEKKSNLKPRDHENAYRELKDYETNVDYIQKKGHDVKNDNKLKHMIRFESQNEVDQIKVQDVECRIIDNKIDETLKQGHHCDTENKFIDAGEDQNLILKSKHRENEINLKCILLLQNKDEKESQNKDNEHKISLKSDILIQENIASILPQVHMFVLGLTYSNFY